jgi:hypothetical protein
MIAIPSGASGIGTSQRWIRKRSPGNHSKVTWAPISAGGMSLKVATSLHSPTSGCRASRESWLLVLAVIVFLLSPTTTWLRARARISLQSTVRRIGGRVIRS